MTTQSCSSRGWWSSPWVRESSAAGLQAQSSPSVSRFQLVERRQERAPGEPVLEIELLNPGQVFEQASQRHRRRPEPTTQSFGAHIGTLPRERAPVACQGDHGHTDLVAAQEALEVPLWWLAGREAEAAQHAPTLGMLPRRWTSADQPLDRPTLFALCTTCVISPLGPRGQSRKAWGYNRPACVVRKKPLARPLL